jgi:methionyl-tRNA synthetase
MYQGGSEFFGLGAFPALAFAPLLLWALAWKGWALYLAARRDEKVWFIVLLIVNTLGLLEIFYIFAIAKRGETVLPTQEKKSDDHTATPSAS